MRTLERRMLPFGRKLSRAFLAACTAALLVMPVQAYIQFSDPGTGAAAGTFVFSHWPALPINYIVDRGPAPAGFTEATLVTPAFNAWANVATSNVAFNRLANPSTDPNWTCADMGTTWGMSTDNNFEVVYDDNGTCLGTTFGVGLTTVDTTTGNIIDATLILNSNPGGGGADMLATLVHEIGHTLGMAHSYVGNQGAVQSVLPDAAIPTMYPFQFPNDDTQGRTLEADDISGISTIYSETANNPPNQVPWRQGTGAIAGFVFRGSDGTPVRGVHVRAINRANANIQLARLSDYQGQSTGEFLIEGMPPGEYNVVIEAIDGRGNIQPNRIEDDGIGGPGNAYSGFPDDFFANSESNGEPLLDTVPVRVYADWRTSAVYVVTNEGTAADLAVRPWGVEDHPIHTPWWSSSDIYVDNDADGVNNENGEPSRGNAGNQLYAVVRNIGNLASAPYKVVFSFSPYTSAGAAAPQQIAAVNRPGLASGGSDVVGPVAWDLSAAGLSSFPPQFQTTDHFCVKVTVQNQDGSPALVDADPKNNLAQSNFGNVPLDSSSGGRTTFFVVNTKQERATAWLRFLDLPRGWEIKVNGGDVKQKFELKPGEFKPIEVEVRPRPDFFAPEAPGQQGIQIAQFLDGVPVGGLTINFIDPKKFPPVKPRPSEHLWFGWLIGPPQGDFGFELSNPYAHMISGEFAIYEASGGVVLTREWALQPHASETFWLSKLFKAVPGTFGVLRVSATTRPAVSTIYTDAEGKVVANSVIEVQTKGTLPK